ncbi:unnamed protein product [Pseudo-nitzschia multistriata]|uniref:Uncharacterized protein n=1 Tax=Pseudo-nitzschia multistriata TaxID=183589 RepID=A0A448Z4K9_9STRA|nr:unnamed protein product [Pseudo-nitzschia multistriata]
MSRLSLFEIEASKEDAIDVDDVDEAIVPVPGLVKSLPTIDTTCAGVFPSRDKNVTVPSATTKCPCCIDPGGRAVT